MDLNGTERNEEGSEKEVNVVWLLVFCIMGKLIGRKKWENMQSSRSRGCFVGCWQRAPC